MSCPNELLTIKKSLYTKLISGFNVLEALIFCLQDMEDFHLDVRELVMLACECCEISYKEALEYVDLAQQEYKSALF